MSKQSIDRINQSQNSQHYFSSTLSDKIKYKPKLRLLKSLLKDKSISLLNQQSRIYNKQNRTIEQIQVEPEVKLDELKEHKWQILSQNCQYLLELSRQILDKPNYEQLYKTTSNPRLNGLLLENNQAVKSTNNVYTKQNANNQSKDSIQTKLAQIQNSKKKQKHKSFNITNNINHIKVEKPFLKKHQSLHVSPTTQAIQSSQISQLSTKIFFSKLKQVSSDAYNLQLKLKQEQTHEIKQLNQKVYFIKSDFDKYSKMINQSEPN